MNVNWLTVKWVLAAILLMLLIVGGLGFIALNNDQDLRANLLRDGQRTSGKIVELSGSRGAKNVVDIEFRTLDGRDVRAIYLSEMPFPERDRLEEGMTVDVVYDVDDPSRAIPAPYQTVPQRDVVAELFEFLRRIGLALLICSPLIVVTALWRHRLSSGRTKTPK